ncbi:MAG: hypothetical protein QM758_00690 [Armatimonas sp.]
MGIKQSDDLEELKQTIWVIVSQIARHDFSGMARHTHNNTITPEVIQQEMDSFRHGFSDFPIDQMDAINIIEYADGLGYSVDAPLWESPTKQSDLTVIFHVTRQKSNWVISIQDVHVL